MKMVCVVTAKERAFLRGPLNTPIAGLCQAAVPGPRGSIIHPGILEPSLTIQSLKTPVSYINNKILTPLNGIGRLNFEKLGNLAQGRMCRGSVTR